jgi:GNAT superfamily N-acetyltransferase
MGRRTAALTGLTVADLPLPCRECAFWESAPPGRLTGTGAASAALKRDWVEATTSAWGPVGQVVYVDEVPVGYVMYAPPGFVPRSPAFPTAPVAPDAVLLMAAHLVPDHRGSGLGRVLVQSAAKDLTKRGVRAIEAYGANGSGCVLPVMFLSQTGFVTVRENARYPRMRLDLRTALSWRDPVEGALSRFRGAVRAYPAGASRV